MAIRRYRREARGFYVRRSRFDRLISPAYLMTAMTIATTTAIAVVYKTHFVFIFPFDKKFLIFF
jgi:hypothetical protein